MATAPAQSSDSVLDVGISTISFEKCLYVLFFFSGFPALIYQIVWQRALFTLYGVNVESVTVVVTAFMLGLGLGSLVGGQVSRSGWSLVPVFAAIELGTAICGILSLPLFHRAAQFTAGASTLLTGVCAFTLVAIPTLLMGSTLPILLAYVVRVVPNMGRATGTLYFVNTLGSSIACFVAGLFTMRLLGMSGSVRLAAAINAFVGTSALVAWLATRKPATVAALAVTDGGEAGSVPRVLPFSVGVMLAAFGGFIALGYEVVWYRLFSWASGTNPTTFAYLLGSYLAGLAFGALAIERRCRSARSASNHLWFAGMALVGGNLVAAGLPLVLSTASPSHGQTFAMVWLSCAAGLLGTTFPIVCHLTVRPDGSAGRGLSFLYLSNIVGSAAGSFVTGYVLMEFLSLWAISGLLATTGAILGFILISRTDGSSRTAEPASGVPVLSRAAAVSLAGFSGFSTLGFAMWWRLVIPGGGAISLSAFLPLLGSCLIGWALGALGVERHCRSARAVSSQLWFTGILLVAGNIMAASLPSILSVAPREYAGVIAMIWVAGAAALLGTTFPMARHLAAHSPDGSTESPSAKERAGLLNFGYVAGAAAGSLGTGYVLVGTFPLAFVGVLLALSGTVLGFAFLLRSGAKARRHAFGNAVATAAVLAFLVFSPQRTYENLCSQQNSCPGGDAAFSRVIENRHGVVAVVSDRTTVIGGGAYDGRFSVSPLEDVNAIKRCYSLFGFLSRPPKHVLMVGLSSGSWVQVVAHHPEVETVTVVEINPGYLKLIPEHPEVASLLHNPKVKVVIDDGHRWLLRNPDAKFDLVIMNNTFFWRANMTNLLSRDFLELVRRHLEAGGAFFYNTTYSPDALLTAVSVFPHAVRVANHVGVSEAPLRFHPESWQELMKAYRIDGAPVLDLSRRADQVFLDTVVRDAQVLSGPSDSPQNGAAYFETDASLRARLSGRTIVTDDNMAVEWRGTRP